MEFGGFLFLILFSFCSGKKSPWTSEFRCCSRRVSAHSSLEGGRLRFTWKDNRRGTNRTQSSGSGSLWKWSNSLETVASWVLVFFLNDYKPSEWKCEKCGHFCAWSEWGEWVVMVGRNDQGWLQVWGRKMLLRSLILLFCFFLKSNPRLNFFKTSHENLHLPVPPSVLSEFVPLLARFT